MSSFFSLSGQVALVTGATNGIGLGYAKGLANAGIDQLILTYRSKAALEEAVLIIQEVNPKVKIDSIEADFTDPNIDEMIDKIATKAYELSKSGKIDILINNSGITYRTPFEEFPQDKFDEVIKVNLTIPVKLTKRIGMKMLETKTKGNIVFTGSLLSFQGGEHSIPYAIAKGGIKQFTQALSNEWSYRGIRVNCIAPGYIKTEMTDSMDPVYRNTLLERIPMGRWGNIDDLQGPIVFLVSEASRYITGETLVVDGGWLAS